MHNDTVGYSPNVQDQRKEELLALLRQTAPEIISDNQLDLERLKELLGEERLASAEHYELSWAGKAAARREIQKTTSHTLLPAADNPEHAQHMLIEGENLEVLRVLQKSYYGKVKMIYIDPPYNTGNDSFVYPDDYSETLDEYQRRTGEKNEAGYLNKQSLWKKNSKESGQYHSAWLSMMYPRLYLARNLLRDDGVIFIHIDENEYSNLELLLNEIFGEENNLGTIVWDKRNPKGKVVGVAFQHEYIVALCKNKSEFSKNDYFYKKKENAANMLAKASELIKKKNGVSSKVGKEFSNWINDNKNILSGGESAYKFIDDNGDIYQPVSMAAPDKPETRSHRALIHPLTEKPCPVPEKGWRYPDATMDRLILQGRIIFGDDETTQPRNKYLLKENLREAFSSLIYFGGDADCLSLPFSNPKPTSVYKKIIDAVCRENGDVILDFFAGSGTANQAVMELNLEDGGNRQCICVQMPEVLEETSEAYKAGYRTIADITRARIDKIIAKLKAEQPDKTADLACANFTLAPSNFKVWRSDVADVESVREQLQIFQQAEKQTTDQTATQTAMLTELLLKNGLGALGVHAISRPQKLSCGITIHRVLMNDDKVLWLCFEPYAEGLKEDIVKAKPAQVILLNSCFVGDKADEKLSNLQLELAGLDIGLLVI